MFIISQCFPISRRLMLVHQPTSHSGVGITLPDYQLHLWPQTPHPQLRLEWGAPTFAAVGCSLPVTSCLLHFNYVLCSVGNGTHLDFEKAFFFGCYRKYQACMKENSVTTPHVSVTQQQQLTQGLSCFFFTPASTPVGHFWSTLREHIISFINIAVCSSKRERSVFDNQNTTIKKFFFGHATRRVES